MLRSGNLALSKSKIHIIWSKFAKIVITSKIGNKLKPRYISIIRPTKPPQQYSLTFNCLRYLCLSIQATKYNNCDGVRWIPEVWGKEKYYY